MTLEASAEAAKLAEPTTVPTPPMSRSPREAPSTALPSAVAEDLPSVVSAVAARLVLAKPWIVPSELMTVPKPVVVSIAVLKP